MTSETLFSAMTGAASVIAIVVAVYAVRVQNRQSGISLEASLIRDLSNDFSGDHLVHCRYVVATYLVDSDKRGDPPPEIYELLDFLDWVGMYHRTGVIRPDLAWTTFYYWIGHYWHLLGDYAEAFQQFHGGAAYYHDLPVAYEKLTAFGRKHREMPSPDVYFNQERVSSFLLDEIRTCSPRPSAYPLGGAGADSAQGPKHNEMLRGFGAIGDVD